MREWLLEVEVSATEARRPASLERFASQPAPWRLADFDFEAQPSNRALVDELGSLRFLDDATNVLFIGPPGSGKTMLTVGLARAAVEAGYPPGLGRHPAGVRSSCAHLSTHACGVRGTAQ